MPLKSLNFAIHPLKQLLMKNLKVLLLLTLALFIGSYANAQLNSVTITDEGTTYNGPVFTYVNSSSSSSLPYTFTYTGDNHVFSIGTLAILSFDFTYTYPPFGTQEHFLANRAVVDAAAGAYVSYVLPNNCATLRIRQINRSSYGFYVTQHCL
jgi:hypothetical protein